MPAPALPKLRDCSGVDSPDYWPAALSPVERDRKARAERRLMRRAGATEADIAANPVTRYRETKGIHAHR